MFHVLLSTILGREIVSFTAFMVHIPAEGSST